MDEWIKKCGVRCLGDPINTNTPSQEWVPHQMIQTAYVIDS